MQLGISGRKISEYLNENISWQLCKAYGLCTLQLNNNHKPINQVKNN